MTSARLRGIVRERLSLLPCGAQLDSDSVLARDAPGGLARPDHRSANRSCRLFPLADAWAALNLARPEDRDVIPALTGRVARDPWRSLAAHSRDEPAARFLRRAVELQLPAAVLGEAKPAELVASPPPAAAHGLRVIDLSTLWAGPLGAGLLAAAGAEVVRIENIARPDPTPVSSPTLDRRINGAKRRLPLDLGSASDRARMLAFVRGADVLVTSARAPALAGLGLEPRALLAECPKLVWVAITGHGLLGRSGMRVGFGDDCAVAGGLVRWTKGGPRFLGDAVADPLTGIEAALGALDLAGSGKGGLLDLPLAGVAAAYARLLAAA